LRSSAPKRRTDVAPQGEGRRHNQLTNGLVRPVIGYLGAGFPAPSASAVAILRQGLTEAGYVEGRNVAIEYRFAEGKYDRRRRWQQS
jgi:hypothetical protein